MKKHQTERGFQIVELESSNRSYRTLEVQQSSAIDTEKPDGMAQPGSSYLWIGTAEQRAHLDVAGVKELANALDHWLETGKLY